MMNAAHHQHECKMEKGDQPRDLLLAAAEISFCARNEKHDPLVHH
jgi:hypothetical protein